MVSLSHAIVFVPSTFYSHLQPIFLEAFGNLMKLKLSEVALALWHTAGLAGSDTKESPESMWDCESDIISFFSYQTL